MVKHRRGADSRPNDAGWAERTCGNWRPGSENALGAAAAVLNGPCGFRESIKTCLLQKKTGFLKKTFFLNQKMCFFKKERAFSNRIPAF